MNIVNSNEKIAKSDHISAEYERQNSPTFLTRLAIVVEGFVGPQLEGVLDEPEVAAVLGTLLRGERSGD